TVAEGDGGPTNAVFTVTLSAAALAPVTVNFTTSDGSAVAPGDYTAQTGHLTFDPGATTQTITVVVLDDSTVESDETFAVTLSGAVNASIDDAVGTGRILDNDGPSGASRIVIDDTNVVEGNTGTRDMVFTVTLSAPSLSTVTVTYATGDSSAVAPGDYTTTGGTLTFQPGTTVQTIAVPVVGDEAAEGDQGFSVSLSNAVNATIGDGFAFGTIYDDDGTRQLVINDATVAEGDSGTTGLDLTVTLSGAALAGVTVNYATSNSSAVAPGDYTTTGGTLTFQPGTTVQTITVPLVGDSAVQSYESFPYTPRFRSNATIGDGFAFGTIYDDDGTRQLVINDATVVEGDSG